jgi:hypothetical protein
MLGLVGLHMGCARGGGGVAHGGERVAIGRSGSFARGLYIWGVHVRNSARGLYTWGLHMGCVLTWTVYLQREKTARQETQKKALACQ